MEACALREPPRYVFLTFDGLIRIVDGLARSRGIRADPNSTIIVFRVAESVRAGHIGVPAGPRGLNWPPTSFRVSKPLPVDQAELLIKQRPELLIHWDLIFR